MRIPGNYSFQRVESPRQRLAVASLMPSTVATLVRPAMNPAAVVLISRTISDVATAVNTRDGASIAAPAPEPLAKRIGIDKPPLSPSWRPAKPPPSPGPEP